MKQEFEWVYRLRNFNFRFLLSKALEKEWVIGFLFDTTTMRSLLSIQSRICESTNIHCFYSSNAKQYLFKGKKRNSATNEKGFEWKIFTWDTLCKRCSRLRVVSEINKIIKSRYDNSPKPNVINLPCQYSLNIVLR